jgi:hypothetical protein
VRSQPWLPSTHPAGEEPQREPANSLPLQRNSAKPSSQDDIGFGSANFYQKNGCAYLAAGLNFRYALPVPEQCGRWTVSAGATYYNTDKEVTGNSRENDVVGSLGLGISF